MVRFVRRVHVHERGMNGTVFKKGRIWHSRLFLNGMLKPALAGADPELFVRVLNGF